VIESSMNRLPKARDSPKIEERGCRTLPPSYPSPQGVKYFSQGFPEVPGAYGFSGAHDSSVDGPLQLGPSSESYIGYSTKGTCHQSANSSKCTGKTCAPICKSASSSLQQSKLTGNKEIRKLVDKLEKRESSITLPGVASEEEEAEVNVPRLLREREREKRRGRADNVTGRADDVLLTEELMLQTIYEADSCFFSDSIGKHRLPHNADMHNVNNSVRNNQSLLEAPAMLPALDTPGAQNNSSHNEPSVTAAHALTKKPS
ncbi:hypothetical protein DNTS_034587, partial [Danionella cerebrum]